MGETRIQRLSYLLATDLVEEAPASVPALPAPRKNFTISRKDEYLTLPDSFTQEIADDIETLVHKPKFGTWKGIIQIPFMLT